VRPDLLIRNAAVYDGSGASPVVGDVAVAGDRIVGVGRLDAADCPEVLDATGLCLAPGFIDLHTHSDGRLCGRGADHSAVNHLRQGCTTVVTGNCGFGMLEAGRFLTDLNETGVGVNVLHLIGHGSVRAKVMGASPAEPTAGQLDEMSQLVRRGMETGAAGMSTGLLYAPGAHAKTAELIELAKVAGACGGLYASHIRHEGAEVLSAVAEAIRIGREARCRVQISHFKTIGPKGRGLGPAMCRLVEQARRDGVEVTADQYPYIASSTDLASTVVPLRARDDFRRRLAGDAPDAALLAEIAEAIDLRGRAEGILLTRCPERPEWEGKTLAELAESMALPAPAACVEVLKVSNPEVISFALNEADARFIAGRDYVATGSDGSVPRPDGMVHPRSFGTFPRKIGLWARDRGWLSVAQAVRSATGLPADILRLPDRGYVRPGFAADLVVFDLDALTDRATFRAPRQYATGLRRVYVAGQAAVVDDTYTGALAGRGLARPAAAQES